MTISALAKKLQIRLGYTVLLLNAPAGIEELLSPLPGDVTVVKDAKGKVDFVLSFVKSSEELTSSAKQIKEMLAEDIVLWFAYPKLSSKITSDLTRDRGWQPIYDMGFDGVASVAIDSTWSGVRFRRGVTRVEEDLVAHQYAGVRAPFFPLYEQLVAKAHSLGDDVEIQPRQTYVAFARVKQFALVKPSRDRLDLALKLPNVPEDARLQADAGVGSGSMTHRVVIANASDIDDQVTGWLEQAYHAAGK